MIGIAEYYTARTTFIGCCLMFKRTELAKQAMNSTWHSCTRLQLFGSVNLTANLQPSCRSHNAPDACSAASNCHSDGLGYRFRYTFSIGRNRCRPRSIRLEVTLTRLSLTLELRSIGLILPDTVSLIKFGCP